MSFETVFIADNGKKFVFGRNGSNYYGMSIGNGMAVNLGIAQGFGQVGETVQAQSVGGRTIDVSGELYGDIPARKNSLRSACAPLTAGKLWFQGKYYIRVYVKSAPSFSAVRDNGLFRLQFYAPFPYYIGKDEKVYSIGEVRAEFSFPVNDGATHRFGTKSMARYINVINDGDVSMPLNISIAATSACTNVTITNLETLEFLKISGTINAGERVSIYRDHNNAVRAELISGESITDIISRIDDDSTLFELAVGDNLLAAVCEEGGNGLSVRFSFSKAVVSIYED